MGSLVPPRGIFYRLNELDRVSKINPIDVNFHLQIFLKFFDKNSADKFWSKNGRRRKVPSLMPIRVKAENKHLEI